MTPTKAAKLLEGVLLGNEKFSSSLYQNVLSTYVEEITESLENDADHAILCIIIERNETAMFLATDNKVIFENAEAKQQLISSWKDKYKDNILKVIPIFSKSLSKGELAVAGIKYA